MSPESQKGASDCIIDQLVQGPWLSQARIIALYASIKDEVQTSALLQELYARPGLTVLLPRITGDELKFYRVTDTQSLIPGYSGILEPDPDKHQFTPLSQADLILVPGLAFDEHLNRLGKGKGHYDRALGECKPATIRVGLFFEAAKLEKVPVEDHDQPLNVVITEKKIYQK